MTGDDYIRWTVRIALGFWFGVVAAMVTFTPADWSATTARGRWARWAWTCGAGWFLVHVLVAYHFAFGWSHAAALAHPEARSGFGPGLYITHIFTVGWLADVCWWWFAPVRYSTRLAWLGWLGHGLMLFLSFNGTIVYETGPIRYVASGTLAALAGWAWWCWRRF